MPRWPEDSRRRLVDAATALFAEQGFAATTVDEIAASAGVTARTFFRHFRDKEEVLFAEDDTLLPVLVASITESPHGLSAEQHMHHVLASLADRLEPQRAAMRQRQRVIETDVALAGRELAKQVRWQQAIAEALRGRGFAPADAELLAAIGFALFRGAMLSWMSDEIGPPLRERVLAALPRVRSVLDATAG
ncbi:TetR/AcrR family transcriptional regulator [Microcella alkalica]|uniref:AcrR family transcriptional regulator n=1 Tax=Microcella alkalica TaxID=355930 RepID=A0A839EGD9_9MICO|nr:TetR/AcrR family transcriptional regulator [Microcella alkalica]MBA8848648.1 AcrR family transcriptional regulator [Microcella alkalica]